MRDDDPNATRKDSNPLLRRGSDDLSSKVSDSGNNISGGETPHPSTDVPDETLAPNPIRGLLGDSSIRSGTAGEWFRDTEKFSTETGRQVRYLKKTLHRQGGLGQVFVAIDQELSREIALKEIREQFAHDPESQVRFVREAEITGRLEHPGIVPVYGFGTHEDGRPYYAMRFIRGDSLEDAIDRFHKEWTDGGKTRRNRPLKSLAFRDMIKRLIDACHAIHYAHSRGILHRDIKPANIMLGQYGETLVVDWGLAKVIGDSETQAVDTGVSVLKLQAGGSSSPTVMGSAFGTVGYMSPEQFKGELDKLSPTSDVFSLGATLFHVLTGQRPLKDLTAIADIHKAVCRGEIESPRTIRPFVDASMEAICRKAMQVEPSSRYSSALQMAMDLERYLADSPVEAFPEPFLIVLNRWVRRNTATVIFSLIALLAGLTAAATIALINTSRNLELKKSNQVIRDTNARYIEEAKFAKEQEEKAQERELQANKLAQEKEQLALAKANAAEEAEEVSNFLLDLFQASDPVRMGNKVFRGKPMSAQLSARDLLDRGAKQLQDGGSLKGHDRSRAKLMGAIGDVYRQLSLFDDAEDLLKQSVALYEKMDSPEPAAVAEGYHKLAQLQHEQGDYPRGVENYNKALELLETISGDEARAQTAKTYHNMGWLLANMGDSDNAQEFLKKAVKVRKDLPDYGPNHRETLFSQVGVAFCLIEQERWGEALPIVLAAAPKLQGVDDNKNTTTAMLRFAKGVIFRNTTSAKLAEIELQEVVKLVATELGTDGIYYALAQFELANALLDQNREDEAMELMNNCVLISRRTVHMKHPRIRILLDTYAPLLVKNKRTQEAIDLWKEYLDAQQTRFGDEDAITYENMTSYMRFQISIGDSNGALETITKIETGIEPLQFKERNEILAFALRKHAGILYDQKTNSQLAVDLASRALELYRGDAKLGKDGSFEWFRAHVTLARACLQDGQLERSFELLNTAEKMISSFSGKDKLFLKDDIQYEKANWYLLAGDIPNAVLCCEKRLDYAKTDAELYPDIARSFISCAESGQTTGVDASIVESCFAQAVDALSKALRKGKISVETVKKSMRFAILFDRDDFKAILEREESEK